MSAALSGLVGLMLVGIAAVAAVTVAAFMSASRR